MNPDALERPTTVATCWGGSYFDWSSTVAAGHAPPCEPYRADDGPLWSMPGWTAEMREAPLHASQRCCPHPDEQPDLGYPPVRQPHRYRSGSWVDRGPARTRAPGGPVLEPRRTCSSPTHKGRWRARRHGAPSRSATRHCVPLLEKHSSHGCSNPFQLPSDTPSTRRPTGSWNMFATGDQRTVWSISDFRAAKGTSSSMGFSTVVDQDPIGRACRGTVPRQSGRVGVPTAVHLQLPR